MNDNFSYTYRYARYLIVPVALLVCHSGSAEVAYRIRWVESGCRMEPSLFPDPLGLSDSGQVCGFLDREEYRYNDVWSPSSGQIINIPDPGLCLGGSLIVYDIAASGNAVGAAGDEACRAQAWIGDLDGISFLPGFPDWHATRARALNESDQVVGEQYLDPSLSTPIACLWDPVEGLIDLHASNPEFTRTRALAINDRASPWVLGFASNASQAGTFIWRMDDRRIDLVLPGVPGYAMNDAGQIVGRNPPGSQTSPAAFLWTPTDPPTFELLEFSVPVIDSSASSINNDGTVTGYFQRPDGEYRPFVWSAARGVRDLMTLIDPCEPRECVRDAFYTVEINNVGQIVCGPLASPGDYYRPAAVLTPYIRGDLDEDDDCDLQDLAYLLANFGTESSATYADGDLNCDQDVDLQDLAILLANFGETLP